MPVGRHAYESSRYRTLRNRLLKAEIALRDQRERVAALRRRLPLDTRVEDYLLQEVALDGARSARPRRRRLSQLFTRPGAPLVLYQFMYGGAQTKPCPMCSLWIDGFHGVAKHLAQTMSFAVVAEAEPAALRRHARDRGWTNLRLLSSAGSTLKRDLNFEDGGKAQFPGVSVFVRRKSGDVRLSYSVSAFLADGEYRGLDLLCPVWHVLDLLPAGRGRWMPQLRYGAVRR